MYNFFKKGLLGATVIAMASLTACEDETTYEIYQDPTDITLQVAQTNLEFKGNATRSQLVDITSPVSPTVTSTGNWRELAIVDYTPHYNFQYRVLPIASLDERSYTITVKAGDATQTVNVHQTPADPGFLGLGWNLGNHFDTSNMEWGYWDHSTPTAELYQGLKAEGFSSVRIPITWTNHMDQDYKIDANYLAEVGANVDNALAAGLQVIVNTHHDSFETALGLSIATQADSTWYANLIANTWTQIATYFVDRDKNLMFETFNEVHDGDNWSTNSQALFDALNKWNQIAVNAIRATGGNNATRCIGISGYAANVDLTIDYLVLPNDPGNNLAVSVHNYDPYKFCLEASVNEWGSDAEKQAIDDLMFKLADKFLNNGVQVYMGEFGCSKRANAADEPARLEWLKYFARMARTYGISLMLWDNASNAGGQESHAYFDHNNGKIVDEDAAAALKAITDGYNNVK